MAIQTIDDHKNATGEPSPGDGAQTWKGWAFGVLAGTFILGGGAKLLIFLWHGFHAARLTGLACHYFGICH